MTYPFERIGGLLKLVEPFVNETDERVDLGILRRLGRCFLCLVQRLVQAGARREGPCESKAGRGWPSFVQCLAYAASASSKRPLAQSASPSRVWASASAASR